MTWIFLEKSCKVGWNRTTTFRSRTDSHEWDCSINYSDSHVEMKDTRGYWEHTLGSHVCNEKRERPLSTCQSWTTSHYKV